MRPLVRPLLGIALSLLGLSRLAPQPSALVSASPLSGEWLPGLFSGVFAGCLLLSIGAAARAFLGGMLFLTRMEDSFLPLVVFPDSSPELLPLRDAAWVQALAAAGAFEPIDAASAARQFVWVEALEPVEEEVAA